MNLTDRLDNAIENLDAIMKFPILTLVNGMTHDQTLEFWTNLNGLYRELHAARQLLDGDN